MSLRCLNADPPWRAHCLVKKKNNLKVKVNECKNKTNMIQPRFKQFLISSVNTFIIYDISLLEFVIQNHKFFVDYN